MTAQEPLITTDMAGEEFLTVKNGMNSSNSSKTWASVLMDMSWTESITTGFTAKKTANGLHAQSKQETEAQRN